MRRWNAALVTKPQISFFWTYSVKNVNLAFFGEKTLKDG